MPKNESGTQIGGVSNTLAEFSDQAGRRWFKGNLHSHTTLSDGTYPPDALAAVYKDNGYDFLALTDHRLFAKAWEEPCEDMLLIPGIEVDINVDTGDCCYHLLGLPNHGKVSQDLPDRWEQPVWEGIDTVQSVIDSLRNQELSVVLCHPLWSKTTIEQVTPLEGFFAMEVYNHGCVIGEDNGVTPAYWDAFLAEGRGVWAVAVDDGHHEYDTCGGWVMVQAASCTVEGIMESLRSGHFYSTTGPTVSRFERDGRWILVDSSPVDRCRFVTDQGGFLQECSSPSTQIRWPIPNGTSFVRVECCDGTRTAWTNPIFLDS